MFQKLKSIDSAFRYVRGFTLMIIIGCIALSGYALYISYQATLKAQNKVFIISGGKILEAYAADRKDNISIEARDHVTTFHQYFFMLDPDEKVIQSNITKALYLADGSAKRQYQSLKENGYYTEVISGNISQQVTADSVSVYSNSYPFYFRYYGKQTITRPSTITTRSLITEGYLRTVARSDNNPHGFLIERWTILENKDLKTLNR